MKRLLITGGSGFIGTNLLEHIRLAYPDIRIGIVDIVKPKLDLKQNESWFQQNILDVSGLEDVFEKFNPDTVVHLAAETSCEPHLKMEDYEVNTTGSENVFNVSEKFNVVSLIHTSTQFVHQSNEFPKSDIDYVPYTIYGESKMISEKILRAGKYTFKWIIIRPTNVWGKWHLRYPYEFWKVLKEKKYFHPGKREVIRSYGYVGNICYQIDQLVELLESSKYNSEVFYVGDPPINLYLWVNEFSKAITGTDVIVVPRVFFYPLAGFGSLLQLFKIKFPITLSRLESMVTDNPSPMDKTIKILGKGKYSLEEGVHITTKWLKEFWDD